MPDALSKTVPIWTAVLNRYLFPHDTACHELRTPGISVTASEHSQIETRIDGFVEQLKVCLHYHDVYTCTVCSN